jgi:hypothetical protein
MGYPSFEVTAFGVTAAGRIFIPFFFVKNGYRGTRDSTPGRRSSNYSL